VCSSDLIAGRPVPVFLGSLLSAQEIVVRTPVGEEIRVPILGDPVYFASTEHTGLYEVSAPGWETRKFAVNLLNAEESNIAPREKIQLGQNTLGGTTGPLTTNHEIWRSLATLALFLFLLEWWAYHRRYGV